MASFGHTGLQASQAVQLSLISSAMPELDDERHHGNASTYLIQIPFALC